MITGVGFHRCRETRRDAKSIARTLAASVLLIGASTISAAPASADTIIFGNGGSTLPDLLGSVGSFGSSLNGQNVNPSAFSATVGSRSFSLADPFVSFSNVTTDSSGQILAFTLADFNGTDLLSYVFDSIVPANSLYAINTTFVAGEGTTGIVTCKVAPSSVPIFGFGGATLPNLVGSIGTFGRGLSGQNASNPTAFSAIVGARSFGLGDPFVSFSNVTTDRCGTILAFTVADFNGQDLLSYIFDSIVPANSLYAINTTFVAGEGTTAIGQGNTDVPEPATLGVWSLALLILTIGRFAGFHSSQMIKYRKRASGQAASCADHGLQAARIASAAS